MRYQNWDILLFPDSSKVPVQEFKTQCHVTRDYDCPFIHNQAFTGVPYARDGNRPVTVLPVLTTFVESLKKDTPFRVSIHNWGKPKASVTMESLVGQMNSVLFEARVYIDGVLVGHSTFDQGSTWPHVIELTPLMDTEGNLDRLRFPAFHQEILQQTHWEPGELFGRIRVVIAEGFMPVFGSPPAFERFRDVVAFSFQHAPLHILEFSGIAWPNPGMWKQAAFRPTINRQLPNKDEEAHGHSPRRTTNRGEQAEHQEPLNSSRSAFSIMNSRAMLPPLSTSAPANWPHTRPEPGMLSPQSLNLPDDPFLEYYASNALGKRSNQRSSIEDVAMPDYASTQSGGESKRAFSDLTRMSYEQMANPVGLLGSNLDVDVDELLRGLSPEKKHELRQKLGLDTPAEAGPQPPANTPVAGAPSSNRPSAAAQARWASAGRAAVRFTSLPSQTVRTDHQAYRQPTPRFSALDGACSEASVAKPSPTPSDTVQSKKVLTPPEANRETTSSSHEPSLPPQSGSSLSTRVTASLRADHPVPDDLKTKASPEAKKRAANDLGSPSRKVSKRISSQGGQNNEGSSLGSPWDDIVNVDD